MRRFSIVIMIALALVSLLVPGAQAARKLKVVATIPDLKSLTEAIGGDLVEVESLTRGTQNFHDAEVPPSMMLKLRRDAAAGVNRIGLHRCGDAAHRGANKANTSRGSDH